MSPSTRSHRTETPPEGGRQTRRAFLFTASAVAGGVGLAHLTGGATRGDQPQDCAPFPDPPEEAVPFKPNRSLPVRVRKSSKCRCAAGFLEGTGAEVC
jgi:hypothetical protein